MADEPRIEFFRRMPGYWVKIVPQENENQFYWHCYRRSERFNGGLSCGLVRAYQDAELAAYRDFSEHWTAVVSPVRSVVTSYRNWSDDDDW